MTPGIQKIRSLSLLLSANVVSAACSGAVGVIAARALGASGRGAYASTIVMGTAILCLLQAGLSQSLTFAVAQQRRKARGMLQATLPLLLLQALALYLCAASTASLHILTPETLSALGLYFLYLPCFLFWTYISSFCLGIGRIDLFNYLKLAINLPLFLAAVIALLFDHHIVFLFQTLVVLSYAQSAVLAVRFRRALWWKRQWRARTTVDLLEYGVRAYPSSLCSFANFRLDQLVLSFAVSQVTLGNYSVAVSYSALLCIFSTSVATFVFPRVAAAIPERKSREACFAVIVVVCGSAVGALFLWRLQSVLFPLLYGTQFPGAFEVIPVLLAAACFLGANFVLGDILRGLNMPAFVSAAEAFAAIVTCLGLYWFVPRLGIYGAAVVSLAAYATLTVTLAVRLLYDHRDRVRSIRISLPQGALSKGVLS